MPQTIHIDDIQAGDISPAPPPVGVDWWKENAPPQNAPKSAVPQKPVANNVSIETKKPSGRRGFPIPKDTPILGAPILPVEGIVFAGAATALGKLDKALGLTGETGEKPIKIGKQTVPPYTRIQGAPVTPKPSEAPRAIEPSPATPPASSKGPLGYGRNRFKGDVKPTNEALTQLLKVEPPGPKRDALLVDAKERGIEVPTRETTRTQSRSALQETARISAQFDEAERRLAEKAKSRTPPGARKAAGKPVIPEEGTPENVARVQDARERIIGKPPDQWTNAEVLAADDLIRQGYTGAGGSAAPVSTKRPAPPFIKPKPVETPVAKAVETAPQTPEGQLPLGAPKPISEFKEPSPVPPAAAPKPLEGGLPLGAAKPIEDFVPPKPASTKPEGALKLTEQKTEEKPKETTKETGKTEEFTPPPVFTSGFAAGSTGKAKVARGYKVPFRYAVVDADNLITSHDPVSLQENPAFDQSIQPRDRSRAGYEEQINTMTGLLDPEELGHSYKASDGAPIVGEDGMVESGNGRTISLKRVYDGNTDKATEYRDWLKSSAKDFGIDPTQMAGIKKPVLVRLRTELPEGVTRADFAEHANEDAKATMGAVETATADSRGLTPEVMALFEPSETGEINTAANRAFVQKFASSIIGPGQKNPFMLGDGSISAEGVRRIKNAIFSKAYGGSTALEKLAEDPSDNTKAITNGLVIAAPKFADMQSAIEQGNAFDLNPAPYISRAVSRLASLRDQKMSIQDFLNQEDLYGKDPVEGVILDIFDQHKRSAKRIGQVFKAYADAVEALGSPKQQGFFSQEPPTIFELLESANDIVKEESKATDAKEEDAAPLLAESARSGGKN